MEQQTLLQRLLENKKFFWTAIGVFMLCLIFLYFLFSSFFSSNTAPVTTQTPNAFPPSGKSLRNRLPVKSNSTGTLYLLSNKKTYSVGDTITLNVIADTGGKQVRGYDAVFRYDSTKVTFLSEKNMYRDFYYKLRLRPDWVIITGTEDIASSKNHIFKTTHLMSVSFKAVHEGTASFPLSYIPGSFNDSNLLDISSRDILSKAGGIIITIQP